MNDSSLSVCRNTTTSDDGNGGDCRRESVFGSGSPPAVKSFRTVPENSIVPQNNQNSISPAANDAADQEYREFLVELNQSTGLGLTAAELESLATVPESMLLNLSAEDMQVKQVAPQLCTEKVTICDCHLSSLKVSSSELVPLSPSRSLGGPNANCIKESTASSSRSLQRFRDCDDGRVRIRSQGCRTLSLAILPKPRMRKRSLALVCTHEVFPHYELGDGKDKERSSTERKVIHDHNHGPPRSSSSLLSSSDQCVEVQCRVICLSGREHLVLCKYEKATESFEKLNKKNHPQCNSFKLFLLRQKPEVHLSGERFDDGRVELLRHIRRANLWWARHRHSPRKEPRTQLPVSRKPMLKPKAIHHSFPSSSSVAPTATVESAADCAVKVCTDYPDCRNSWHDGRVEKTACLPVLIKPRQKHSILVAYENREKIVEQLINLFKFENCRISLLRGKPMFHVSGSKLGSVTVFMLNQLVQRASSEQEIGKWLMERGILPVVPHATAVGDNESSERSSDAGSGSETASVPPASMDDAPSTILCPNPFCANTKRPEEVQGIPGIFYYRVCHRVELSPHSRHALFLICNRDGWLDKRLAAITSKFKQVRICLLKKIPEFHIHDPENECPSLPKDLEELIGRCRSEFGIRLYVDRFVENTLNPWVCSLYPDCTNSIGMDVKFKFLSFSSQRCRQLFISRQAHQFLMDPVYREKILRQLLKLAPPLGSHSLQICLLKVTNAIHVRCSKRGLERTMCDVIQDFLKTYKSIQGLKKRLDSLELGHRNH